MSSQGSVRPSMGSWVSYGLRSDNDSLPAFLCLDYPSQHGGVRNYGHAFLPAMHQGTQIKVAKPGSQPIRHLTGDRLTQQRQREQLDIIQALNQEHLRRLEQDAQVEGVIGSFELAYRMQKVAPEVLDISKESEATKKLYGIGEEPTNAYGRQCLVARRLGRPVCASSRSRPTITGIIMATLTNTCPGALR